MSEPSIRIEKVRVRELPGYVREFFARNRSAEGAAPMSIRRRRIHVAEPLRRGKRHWAICRLRWFGLCRIPGPVIRELHGQKRTRVPISWCSVALFFLSTGPDGCGSLVRAVQSLKRNVAVTAYSREVRPSFSEARLPAIRPASIRRRLRQQTGSRRVSFEAVAAPGIGLKKERKALGREPSTIGIRRFSTIFGCRGPPRRRKLAKRLFRQVTQVDPFPQGQPSPPYFVGHGSINSMLAHPWIMSGGEATVPSIIFVTSEHSSAITPMKYSMKRDAIEASSVLSVQSDNHP